MTAAGSRKTATNLLQRKVPKRARSKQAPNTILLSWDIASTWRQSKAPQVMMFMGTLVKQNMKVIKYRMREVLPEPVHHIRPVRLWNNLAAQVGDGGEVHAYGHLQGEEGDEGQDGVQL